MRTVLRFLDRHITLLTVLVLTALAGVVWLNAGHDRGLPGQADSLAGAHAAAVAVYGDDTLATDSLLARGDTLFKPGLIKAAVHKERRSAKKAITTSEEQVKNLRKQLRVADPRLALVGGLRYGVASDTTLLSGTLEAEVGVQLRLARGVHLQASATQPLAGPGRRRLLVALQKTFRIY